MKIRRLQPEDVKAYEGQLDILLRSCTDISFRNKISDAFYCSKLHDMEDYLRQGRAYIFGAFEGGEILGFLWAYELDALDGRKFHVAYFAVLPEYAGQGVGSNLISAAEQTAKEIGIAKIELIVSKQNESAVSFYSNHRYTAERYIMTKMI